MQPEHWIIAGLALLALFLAVRSRGGCNGHNWEKGGIEAGLFASKGNLFVYQRPGGASPGMGPGKYIVQGNVRYRCSCDGCRASKSEWEQVAGYSPGEAPGWVREASLGEPLP